MEQKLQDIRESQKASWNQFSAGWKKWDDQLMTFMKPFGNEMICMLNPKAADVILDIAGGTGEPGLTMATMLKGGKVVITDLAGDMLAVAQEKATKRGIGNVETIVCDVSELPFEDNSFDVISCRFGFMFFPDMRLAIKEMVRVLKPGGRIAAAVWNVPEKNFWVTAMGSTINKNMQITPPPPDAPGMFRCAKSGFLQYLFSEAGLNNTKEREVNSKLESGTAENYWNNMTEVAAPFASALGKADDWMIEKIKKEVTALLNEKFPDGNVAIDANALVVYGEK